MHCLQQQKRAVCASALGTDPADYIDKAEKKKSDKNNYKKKFVRRIRRCTGMFVRNGFCTCDGTRGAMGEYFRMIKRRIL